MIGAPYAPSLYSVCVHFFMLISRFWGSALTFSAPLPPWSDRSPQRSEPFQDGPATSLIHSLHRHAHTNACRFNAHSKEEAGTGRLFIKLMHAESCRCITLTCRSSNNHFPSPWPLFQLLNAARLTFITTGEATLHERLCNLIRCRETFEQVDFISV